jgi:plastocyanin
MRLPKVLTLALGASLTLAACSGTPAATGTATPAIPSPAASLAASASAGPSAASSPSEAVTATASAAASAAASSSAAGAGDSAEVTIQDFKFEPEAVEVAAGQTVSWANEDGEPHTVRSEDGSISSPIISGTPFTWTAEGEPGTEIPYICSIHPQMKGTVTITE